MATQKKTWERWSDEEVSALLAIYSEGFSPQLRGLPAGDFDWQYKPWSCLRPASKLKAEEEEEEEVMSVAPSGTYSGVNAIY